MGVLNSDLMWGDWGDPSMLAAFIIYTTKRLGVEVFKGWGKGGKKPRPPPLGTRLVGKNF